MAEKEQKPQKPDDDPVGKVYDSRLMRRLGHYLRPYWLQAAVSTLAISLKSLCDVTGPFLVMVAIDRYFPSASGSPLSTNLLARGLGTRNALTRHLSDDPIQGITQLAEVYLGVAPLRLSLPIHSDLPDAVDRPEADVRPAPRDLPPHAAHAHRLL